MEPPPLPSSDKQRFWSTVLSLFLVLFLADAAVTFLSTGLFCLSHHHFLNGLAGVVSVLTALVGLGVYSSLGVCALIPKRYFLPPLCFQVGELVVKLPFVIIYFHEISQDPRVESLFDLGLALGQGIVGAGVLYWIQGGWSWRWPLFPVRQLRTRNFSWWTFTQVVLAGLVLVIGLAAYLAYCSALACDRFSRGFMVLHWNHLGMRSKTYSRSDGKILELIPMMHIGRAAFYREVARSIPADASVLLEGVSDQHHLLEQKLDYSSIAEQFNLSAQSNQFILSQPKKRRADVDVADFSKSTLKVINALTRLMADLTDDEARQELSLAVQSPGILEQMKVDLLDKRNLHLLAEIDKELQTSNDVAVPWGAAHMPGISQAMEQAGFRLVSTHEIPVLFFLGKQAKE